MTNATNITDRQIRTLRAEAEAAGDYAQIDVCDVALAAHETPDAEGNDLTGPDRAPMTRSEARALCARAVAYAEAQS